MNEYEGTWRPPAKAEKLGWVDKEMGKTYVGNAFSLQMLPEEGAMTWEIVSANQVRGELDAAKDVASCFGHVGVATISSRQSGKQLEMNRVSVKLGKEYVFYAAQYVGPRLPEGATSLPSGATIKWFKVTIQQSGE